MKMKKRVSASSFLTDDEVYTNHVSTPIYMYTALISILHTLVSMDTQKEYFDVNMTENSKR